MEKRVKSLDYLRGICANGILYYHLFSWTLGRYKSDTLLGRFGVYGVSTFYILSGLTLFIVYSEKIKPDFSSIIDFFGKRFFRIFPLMWVVSIATILTGYHPSIKDIILNFTGFFSILSPGSYIGGGVWSIGNELSFYLAFPILIFSYQRHKVIFYILCGIIFLAGAHFAFNELTPSLTISDQWETYLNPLNQMFLFAGGIIVGIISKYKTKKALVYLIGIISFLIFCFYPAYGNTSNIVTNLNRFVFSVSCFGITYFFANTEFRLPSLIDKILIKNGELSYAIYLLNPIVFGFYFGPLRDYLSVKYAAVLFLLTTYTLSYVSYFYYELKFMTLGKRVIKKLTPQKA